MLHVGIAGARRNSARAVGSIVVGAEAWYEVSRPLSAACCRDRVAAATPVSSPRSAWELGLEPIVFSSARRRASRAPPPEVEAMEGFAVLRAWLSSPASRPRGARDLERPGGARPRAAGEFDGALAALAAAVPRLLSALE